MLVILRQDLNRVGKAGEVVKVKDGYGRNFLIPQGIAYPATDAYMKVYNESTKSKKYKEVQMKKSAEFLKSMLDKTSISIEMKVGEDGKLFGSVTSQHIAEELKAKGIDVDKRKIQLDENIKHLGEYKIAYKAMTDIEATISLSVVGEGGVTVVAIEAEKNEPSATEEDAVVAEEENSAEGTAESTEEEKAE